jgi:pilus assembly protein Flp/PilA
MLSSNETGRGGMGQPTRTGIARRWTIRTALLGKDFDEMVEYVKALFSVNEETEGQGLVEYALIIFLVSIVSIAALTLLGTSVRDVFTQITAAL